MTAAMSLQPIGWVASSITALEQAPRQGDEGAPPCAIVLDPHLLLPAAADISTGQTLLVLTWLHLADRTTLTVHPRGDPDRPICGVFSTRSADRPNPVGVHTVDVLDARPGRLHVQGLEAIDGTPVIDIKPVLGELATR